MARYRSRMALRPINRIKHVVDQAGTISKNTASSFTIAASTDTPTLADTDGCETGSKINGFYLRFEVASNDPVDLGVIPNFYLAIWKNPGGNLSAITPQAVGGLDDKRFVIHQEMTMIENKGQGGNPRTVFNGVVVIPKGMRRMGPNDLWKAQFFCAQLDTVVCMQAHYKEFR